MAPVIAALAFAAGLWLWHAPRMYDAALADPALHTIEHLTFLVTSAVFWRMVSTAGDRRLDGLSAVVIVTLIALQGNLLAALITLAPQPLCTRAMQRNKLERPATRRPADVGAGRPDLPGGDDP